MCDTFNIKNAASSALDDLSRTSYSEDGFTKNQVDAIANAIAEYDKQNRSKES